MLHFSADSNGKPGCRKQARGGIKEMRAEPIHSPQRAKREGFSEESLDKETVFC